MVSSLTILLEDEKGKTMKGTTMPKTIQVELFKFDELDDSAKEKARTWYREGGLDYEWWDCVFDDAKECAKLIGISIDKIYFSGFSSQGDGACFEGRYSYRKGAAKLIRDHAPQDTELHRIADELQTLQANHFYKLGAEVKQRGRYSHEMSTEISTWNGDDDCDSDTEEALKELLRDYMRWIYRQLEKEYDYLNSDESVDESIRANEYSFDSDGRRSRYD
jgi:hypothetical protein